MTQRAARGDQSGALKVFQSLGALILVAATLAIVIVTVVVIFLPLDAWLPFKAISGSAVRWTLWLLAAEV